MPSNCTQCTHIASISFIRRHIKYIAHILQHYIVNWKRSENNNPQPIACTANISVRAVFVVVVVAAAIVFCPPISRVITSAAAAAAVAAISVSHQHCCCFVVQLYLWHMDFGTGSFESKNTRSLPYVHVDEEKNKIHNGICMRALCTVQAYIYSYVCVHEPQSQNLASEENENEFLNVTNERE